MRGRAAVAATTPTAVHVPLPSNQHHTAPLPTSSPIATIPRGMPPPPRPPTASSKTAVAPSTPPAPSHIARRRHRPQGHSSPLCTALPLTHAYAMGTTTPALAAAQTHHRGPAEKMPPATVITVGAHTYILCGGSMRAVAAAPAMNNIHVAPAAQNQPHHHPNHANHHKITSTPHPTNPAPSQPTPNQNSHARGGLNTTAIAPGGGHTCVSLTGVCESGRWAAAAAATPPTPRPPPAAPPSATHSTPATAACDGSATLHRPQSTAARSRRTRGVHPLVVTAGCHHSSTPPPSHRSHAQRHHPHILPCCARTRPATTSAFGGGGHRRHHRPQNHPHPAPHTPRCQQHKPMRQQLPGMAAVLPAPAAGSVPPFATTPPTGCDAVAQHRQARDLRL